MFVCHRWDNSTTAYKYLCGLVQAGRRNIERMEEAVSDSEYEALQQFISNSPWDARKVINRVATEADKLLGGTGETGLLIDETSFIKKGKGSVGVARQWSGRLGKIENSQVAVFAALAAGDRVLPVDFELFLPDEWIEDRERCQKAGVPASRIEKRTKPELALEMIRRQRELGVRFDYVCADGLYGNSQKLLHALDDDGETFLMHVHADKLVYLSDPRPSQPTRAAKRGRPATRLSAGEEAVGVGKLIKTLSEKDWSRVKIRETTTGTLEAEIYRRQVWVWDGEEDSARNWTLFIRRELNSPGKVKFCLTNASKEVDDISLARMEAERFFVERVFEDAKGQAGMAEYQVRGWLAWHHHMAMVLMVMLFMTRLKLLHKDSTPLISCHDIKILLAHFLPRRDVTHEEVLRQMQVRHLKRAAVFRNSRKRQEIRGVGRDKLPK